MYLEGTVIWHCY